MKNTPSPLIKNSSQTRYVKNGEMVAFLMSACFYANMCAMVNNFRQAYFINVLKLENSQVSKINFIVGIVGFGLSFFYALIIDSPPKSKHGKFKPIALKTAIPLGVLTTVFFLTPKMPSFLIVTYLCTVTLLHGAAAYFGNTAKLVAVVMSPNSRERDNIISLRGIMTSIADSAPLLIVLVVGLLRKPGIINTEQMMYVVSAVICSVVGTTSMLIGMRVVKERTTYNMKKENPILGYKDILKNKYALIVVLSEFFMGFRGIGGYMGIFLAAALLGDTSKYIFFGLPTGIGTLVGMLTVNRLLKRFNSKQLYIASGCYSIVANCGALSVGVLAFKNPDIFVFQVIFFFFLFLIGIQYGATDLLPSMFQADILEDLEVKTKKRLDASLGFVISMGGSFSGIIASTIAPKILYGEGSIIKYAVPIDKIVDGAMKTVYQEQPFDTKVRMLAFYTVFNGCMILLGSLPFFLYKLVGKEKEKVHVEVMKVREELDKINEDAKAAGSQMD